jgi:predicted metal-dependent HD superfamily phosphohydrolase
LPLKQSRWRALWQRLGGLGTGDAYFAQLVQAYEQPWRAYHTTAHLANCLSEFDSVRALLASPDLVEAALWFHDAVYDPRASDNEAQSAAWAASVLAASGLDNASIERVSTLILATRHVAEPSDADSLYRPDRGYLADIDLAILGAPPPAFAEYEKQIRQEYAWVPLATFCLKRAQLLETFLDRPRLYATDYFHTRYAEQARRNLQASIQQLQNELC